MARKGNKGGSRRHGTGSGDRGSRRKREDGNDRAWEENRSSTFSLRIKTLSAIFAFLYIAAAINRLEGSPAVWAVYAGIVGLLSSMGALVLVPTDAMSGVVKIGVVFFVFTMIAMVCVAFF